MPTKNKQLNIAFWSSVLLAVLWLAVGDRIVTHLAYAFERGKLQASAKELAQLHAELPEVYAVSRAFKLVAAVARPGVVHIRVAGGDSGGFTEEDIQDYMRQHLKGWLEREEAEDEDSAADEEDAREIAPERERRDLLELAPYFEADELEQLTPLERRQLNDRRAQLEIWLRRMRPAPGSASGIVFDPAGYILTSNHVVADRTDFTVVLHDSREYQAQVVGTDPKTDLAVLKIDAPDLLALTFGDSDALEVGDWVLAVGSPFGLLQTVTHGIVSAVGRTQVPGIDIAYQDFIQTDVAINPGNSGGPLLNLRGEVIGVNTAIATHGDAVNAGVAFTIPSNRAIRIAGQLKDTGEVARGWLGISFSELDAHDPEILGLPDTHGVFVERVLIGQPADNAGVQVEDVIVAVNDVPVTGREQLRGLIADLAPGETAHLQLVRDRERATADVQLGLQPRELRTAAGAAANEAREIKRLGFWARTFRPALIQAYGLAYRPAHRGVLVFRLDPAWKTPRDLEVRELIVGCNGYRVTTVRELLDALRGVPRGEKIELQIEEPVGDTRVITIRLDE